MSVYATSHRLLKENWGFAVFMLLMFASRSSFADWYYVPTGSMQPTILEGDRILVNKMAYRLDVPFTDISLLQTGAPARGDIVVFESKAADTRLIKRVIGLPGDRIAMRNNRLYVNGSAVQQGTASAPYQRIEKLPGAHHHIKLQPVAGARHSFDEVQVPAGHFLVLGDNRNNSMDSRYYGFVPATELQGKAINVIVSLDADDYYLPRKDRLMVPLI